jgi:hypothetical protein
MVRFIGNGVDGVDDPRLESWSERLAFWLKLGLEQVEFFIHEPEDKLVPDVAGRLIDRLNLERDVSVTRWHRVDPAAEIEQLKLL